MRPRLALLTVLLCVPQLAVAAIALVWDPSPTRTPPDGYRVYRRALETDPWVKIGETSGTLLYTDRDVRSHESWRYVVTMIRHLSVGEPLESKPSNELLVMAQLAAMRITVQWEPKAGNARQADTYVVQRQPGAGSAWAEVCRATPDQPACNDMAVPAGEHCWRAMVYAGTRLGGTSPAVCETVEQFAGVVTVTVEEIEPLGAQGQ